jgi:site-specific DNA recombinase
MGQVLDKEGHRRDDASPESQKKRCQRHIDGLNMSNDFKYVISEHISDVGVSGKSTRRVGYQKMWDLVSTKKISFICCGELSRLNRNTVDFLNLLEHCQKNKIALIIIGMNLDTGNFSGKLVASMFAVLSQFEREMTASRVRENAISRLLESGRINGATALLGMNNDPKKKGHFIRNDEEIKVVEQIFKIYLKTSSQKETLLEVQKLGIKDKKGKDFTKGTLGRVFAQTKWRYRGLWALNKENKDLDQSMLPKSEKFQLVKLPHGPIIDIKLLDAVDKKLKETQEKTKRSGKNYTYLLTTILEHSDGSTWTGGSAKSATYRYYYNKKNDIRIAVDELDKLVLKRIKEYLIDDGVFNQLVKDAYSARANHLPTVNNKIKEIEIKLAEVEEEESSLKISLIESKGQGGKPFISWIESSVSELQHKKREYEAELSEALRAREVIKSSFNTSNIESVMKKLLSQFSRLTGVQRRSMVENIFEKIVVDPPRNISFHIYDEVKMSESIKKKNTDRASTISTLH